MSWTRNCAANLQFQKAMRWQFEQKLEDNANLVDPDFELNAVTDDPDDNRVLECAVAGNADLIVSGDRHLLRIGSYTGIAIVSVRQFIETAEL